MQQEDNKRKVRFEGEEEERRDDDDINRNPNNKKCPIIGVNDQFLDPYAVKTSLKEEEALEQENEIVQFTISEGITAEELIQNLDIRLYPERDPIKNNKFVPAVLSLKTKKVSNNLDRPPIDLVCVVDVSGSMIGRKINLVKDSLRYLMKILGPEDRICIIVFTTVAHIVTSFIRNTQENKPLLKKAILELKGLASTNISDGMNKALWMLKNRKYKNPVSCIFLLSDGQDDYKGAEQRVFDQLQLLKIEEKFVIHTFGYGQDHDAYVMNQIAKYREGNFYYIDNINKASDYFILAMSGMLSIYAQNVSINLKSNDCEIVKAFGEGQVWYKQDANNYKIQLNYLLEGESKDFVFELFVKEDYTLNHINLQIEINGQLLKQNLEFRKDSNFQINVSQEKEGQLNEHVEINYQRAKAGHAIGEACHQAQQKQYQQAQELIELQIQQIKQSPHLDSLALKIALEDLEKCKMYCKPKIFEMEGEAFLMKKERNHIVRQSSLTNLCDWNDDQQQNMEHLQNGDLQLSAAGSIKGSDSEVSSQPDFQRDIDFDNFDPKFIIKQLLKMKQFKKEQLEQEDEEDDKKIELLKEQLILEQQEEIEEQEVANQSQ
ncbi:unnamed protein product (macronuclear) [Paramecium tetraurelia]|uniref:VWFA domain-containing protein n=1 Tax=Paramecium tetraurelia TaxID=5888 RepID=A0E9B3_PARTE|nr:uncharacterized protein GSPATT00024611001 [Paramecium tetraurelia]CAK91880.1 unnamed protein product [Paramecium tetraurelia]|eukprot:XP_001459277.1 hypothetical protein (macronuclear) [Paramecium tetraurelia strain d4-2]